MTMFIVGSVAANHAGIHLTRSTTEYKERDLDIIVDSMETWENSEFSKDLNFIKPDILVSKELVSILREYRQYSLKPTEDFASIVFLDASLLYALKLSHMAHDLPNHSWYKHLSDIKDFERHGYAIKGSLLTNLVGILHSFWERYYANKNHINLNVKDPKNFFCASYNQHHDKLHEIFAYNDQPMYKHFLKDGSPVMCDKTKWETLDYPAQITAIVEESMVLAYERKLPLLHGFKHLLTKCSKGWFNLFMIQNLTSILNALKGQEEYFKNHVKKAHVYLESLNQNQ